LIRLNEEGIEKLWGNYYNTTEILDAVDALDEVRYVMSDDDDLKPPEIRRQLLRIHTLAFKQLGEGSTLRDEEVEELADLIEKVDATISGMIRRLVKIQKTLKPLSKNMFKWEDE
jgi:thiamine kinase-like enzyme